MAIEQDATFVRIVKTSEKFHQRGLSCAILADQCEDLAGVQREAKMAHSPSLGVGISESDIFKNEASANRLREGMRIVRRQDFRLDLKEGE